ncbi:MAG: TonB-dependent receptor [Desulfobacteraceae bacterium]|nr:TonB-dependent receptor [Desulfobacteraceae bacterium]MBC2720835.1 TonB-dependent receptor [Desulfobacteraceae bacterium]
MGKYYRLISCYFTSFFIGFLIVAVPTISVGGETGTGKEIAEKKVIKLDDVVVRGEAVGENLEATSATELTNEDITNRVFITPMDIVSLAPGISIKQYKQGGTASSFQMRGFTSCSHGSDVAIYIDGIPLNEGDGYADTNIINPEEIERVELIKGPVSALYGNYASAGVLHFYTKKKVDRQHIKLQYGAYNTYEANFVGGFSSEDKDWEQVYSIQTYHTDGYQDNSDWDKLNAASRITYHFNDALDGSLSVRGFNSDWDAPGWQNKEEYENDPTTSVNDANGGSKDRTSAKIDLNYQLTDESKILFQLWTYDQNFKRWYAGREEGVNPGKDIGNLRDFDRFVWGSGISYNFIGEIGDKELRLTAGIDYMDEDIERDRWKLTSGNGRNKGAQYIDYHIDFESLGLYAEANYQIIKPLRLILGARYDHFSGDLTDHLLNDRKDSMEDQDIFSPKGGLRLSLLDKQLEFFGNYSRGFAMMSGFAEQAQYTQEHWDPQIRIQYELGVKMRPFDWFNWKLIGFRLETDNDFIKNPVTDESENAGETTRDGVEVSLDFYALNYGYLHADYAYIDAKYDNYVENGISYNGNNLPRVQDTIVNIELGYKAPKDFGGWIRYHYQSGQDLDNANTIKGGSWDTVNANLFYLFGRKNRYMIALDVINIFDEKYPSSESYWSENRTYSPGLPLSLYATFTVDF